jgi:hypothetical protein
VVKVRDTPGVHNKTKREVTESLVIHKADGSRMHLGFDIESGDQVFETEKHD